MQAATSDRRFMRLALACARRGEGHTRPNPPVGAVIVRQGRVIASGYHRRAGAAHAEVEALRACGRAARGATLYVTLEPCSSAGRTPPCTGEILRAGIGRVVAGCVDPNPRHAGRGFELLRAAGVRVDAGVCVAECRELIAPFAKQVACGLPWVTLKLALTLDGRIADREGHSRWITAPPARVWVQRLRRRADAIMVGAGTVVADDPELRCRLRGAGETWRVIVDHAGTLPPAARVLRDDWSGHTIVATTARGLRALRESLPAATAVRLWSFPSAAGGRISLRAVLRRLALETGALHVVCEGGGKLAGSLVRAGLVDTCALLYAPALLGDSAARPAVAGLDRLLARRFEMDIERVSRLGGDLLLLARPLNVKR